VSIEQPYYPDPTNELELEWVKRQFDRISSALSNFGGDELEITHLTSSDSPYTVLGRDSVILAQTSGGAITVTLPAAKNQRVLYIKNTASSGSNAVTISGTIDRGTNITLNVNDSAKLIYSESDSGWFIISADNTTWGGP